LHAYDSGAPLGAPRQKHCYGARLRPYIGGEID